MTAVTLQGDCLLEKWNSTASVFRQSQQSRQPSSPSSPTSLSYSPRRMFRKAATDTALVTSNWSFFSMTAAVRAHVVPHINVAGSSPFAAAFLVCNWTAVGHILCPAVHLVLLSAETGICTVYPQPFGFKTAAAVAYGASLLYMWALSLVCSWTAVRRSV